MVHEIRAISNAKDLRVTTFCKVCSAVNEVRVPENRDIRYWAATITWACVECDTFWRLSDYQSKSFCLAGNGGTATRSQRTDE